MRDPFAVQVQQCFQNLMEKSVVFRYCDRGYQVVTAEGAHAHVFHDESRIASLINEGIHKVYNPVLS